MAIVNGHRPCHRRGRKAYVMQRIDRMHEQASLLGCLDVDVGEFKWNLSGALYL